MCEIVYLIGNTSNWGEVMEHKWGHTYIEDDAWITLAELSLTHDATQSMLLKESFETVLANLPHPRVRLSP